MREAEAPLRRAHGRGLRHDRGHPPDRLATRCRRRRGTSGNRWGSPPAPRFRIVDRDGGDVEPGGTGGRLDLRCRASPPATWNNDQANAESFFQRLVSHRRPGPGSMTATCGCWGRLKEMIIRGGENISPYEIEAVLLSHPQVAEAVAFGVDDDKYGQTVGRGRCPGRRRPSPTSCGATWRSSLARVQGAGSHPRAGRDPQDADRQGAASADGGLPGRSRDEVRGRSAPGRSAPTSAPPCAQAGSDVTLIARGPHLQAMIEHGVRVQSRARRLHQRTRPATADIDALAEADVIVIGLKAHSLPELAPADRRAPAAGRRGRARPERAAVVVLPGAGRPARRAHASRASIPAA